MIRKNLHDRSLSNAERHGKHCYNDKNILLKKNSEKFSLQRKLKQKEHRKIFSLVRIMPWTRTSTVTLAYRARQQ